MICNDLNELAQKIDRNRFTFWTRIGRSDDTFDSRSVGNFFGAPDMTKTKGKCVSVALCLCGHSQRTKTGANDSLTTSNKWNNVREIVQKSVFLKMVENWSIRLINQLKGSEECRSGAFHRKRFGSLWFAFEPQKRREQWQRSLTIDTSLECDTARSFTETHWHWAGQKRFVGRK